MLVLTRRAGESIVIGDDVVITILETRGDVVRVGIDAPRSVQVHREEVYRELQAANRAAASASEADLTALTKLLGRSRRTRGGSPPASPPVPGPPVPGPPAAGRPVPGPPAAGRPAPGPSAPGPSAPGPSAPGPSAPGPSAPGR